MSDLLRLIIEPASCSGDWNMAVDAVLLESALATGKSTLRWYRWSEPTLSLGHFQKADDPAIEERFGPLPRVRRLSGGGAILHDQEWTYSLAVGPEHIFSANPSQLYRTIHNSVIQVLSEHGVPASLRGSPHRELDRNFLCFSRGDANDVVIDRHKVLGSAQRRRRGAVLQHGALLLRASALAPEFPGILDLATGNIDDARLFDELTSSTAHVLGGSATSEGLDQSELARATELQPLQRISS